MSKARHSKAQQSTAGMRFLNAAELRARVEEGAQAAFGVGFDEFVSGVRSGRWRSHPKSGRADDIWTVAQMVLQWEARDAEKARAAGNAEQLEALRQRFIHQRHEASRFDGLGDCTCADCVLVRG
jgi:hypothetical protein